MEIFIGKDGQEKSCVTMLQLRDMLENGEVTPDTLGWMREQEGGWKPLREIPAAKAVIDGLAQAKLNADLAKRPGRPPKRSPEPLTRQRAISRYGFARFAARTIDLVFFQNLVVLAVRGVPERAENLTEWWARLTETSSNLFAVLVAAAFAWHLIEAILLATVGTTLGKYALNLSVRHADGEKLGFWTSILRSYYVWLLGMGFALPPLQQIANLLGFVRLHSRGITIWDEQLKVQVNQGPIDMGRRFFVFGVLFLIIGMRYALY